MSWWSCAELVCKFDLTTTVCLQAPPTCQTSGSTCPPGYKPNAAARNVAYTNFNAECCQVRFTSPWLELEVGTLRISAGVACFTGCASWLSTYTCAFLAHCRPNVASLLFLRRPTDLCPVLCRSHKHVLTSLALVELATPLSLQPQ